jgi:hypothetical protein
MYGKNFDEFFQPANIDILQMAASLRACAGCR